MSQNSGLLIIMSWRSINLLSVLVCPVSMHTLLLKISENNCPHCLSFYRHSDSSGAIYTTFLEGCSFIIRRMAKRAQAYFPLPEADPRNTLSSVM